MDLKINTNPTKTGTSSDGLELQAVKLGKNLYFNLENSSYLCTLGLSYIAHWTRALQCQLNFKISQNYIWWGNFISDQQITEVVQILNLFFNLKKQQMRQHSSTI